MARFLIAAVLAALGHCGSTAPTVLPPPPVNDTTLGPSDVFEVRVYGEEALSATYRVQDDGTIDFPLAGRVNVEGLEPNSAAERIESVLREGGFLLEPHVSVLVQEYNSKRISVIGAVREPGSFPMRSELSVVEALSLAGGFTPLASRDSVVLTRNIDGEARRFRLAVGLITEGRAANVTLQSGDIVFVPERVF